LAGQSVSGPCPFTPYPGISQLNWNLLVLSSLFSTVVQTLRCWPFFFMNWISNSLCVYNGSSISSFWYYTFRSQPLCTPSLKISAYCWN
jgi:hypothetical protein